MITARFRSSILCAVAAAPAFFAPRHAAADTPTEAELSSARALFARAEHDEDAEHWQDALDKLRLVARIKETAGIRYHIALCEEHLGALADAMQDFVEAENRGRTEEAKDVLQLVGGALADLLPRVPHVVVRFVPDSLPVEVKLDGAAVDPKHLDVPTAINPGNHSLDATAPGRPPIHTVVAVRERESVVVEIPFGDVLVAPTALAPPAPAPRPAFLSPVPVVVTTAGTIGLAGFGVIAFLLAGDAHDDAVRECAQIASSASDACDGLKNRVRAWDWTAMLSWGAAAAAGIGAVVLWTGHPTRESAVSASIGPGSFDVAGTF